MYAVALCWVAYVSDSSCRQRLHDGQTRMSASFINDSPELSMAAGTCRLSALVSQLHGQGRGWEGGWVGGREEGREGRHETAVFPRSSPFGTFPGFSQLSRGRVGPGTPPPHPHTDEPFLPKRNLRFVTSRPQVQRSTCSACGSRSTPLKETPQVLGTSPASLSTSPPSLHSAPLATRSLWASPEDTLLLPACVTSEPLALRWIFPDRPPLSLPPCFPDSSPPGNSVNSFPLQLCL